jgi:t-SNARE complex subunit (syntaxin)
LKQETENLTQLQSLLDELEQDRRKLSLTPHQLAFYQSIITLMFSNLSEISKQIQKIKHRNITDSKFSKRIFETTTPTVSQDLIESLKDKDEIVDSSFQDTLYLENQTIYSEMNEYLEDVEKIEKSAVEISTLLATFEEKLSEDSFKIEKLYNTTESALEYAKQAKDELQATGDRGQSIFQKLTIWILVFAALWILILDFVN